MIRSLGQGGEGRVYLAWDKHLHRFVAVKRVQKKGEGSVNLYGANTKQAKRENLEGNAEQDKTIMREAGYLQQLEHPMLPIVYDLLEDSNGAWYLVMEYIQGITLREYIERNGFVQETRARMWAGQLTDVLYYLHMRKPPVIYSDLKPDNIMVCPDGRLRLIDFGAAVTRSFGSDRNMVTAVTPGFGAPEQWNRGNIEQQTEHRYAGVRIYADERSDIYAFGKVLYYMVTGADPAKPPYAALPVYEYQPLLGGRLDAIIRKCICQEPERRYQTIEEVQRELNRSMERKNQMHRKSFIRVIEKKIWLTEGELLFTGQECAFTAHSVRT